MNKCLICEELKQKYFEIDGEKIGHILYKTKNFLVIAGYGQIVEGYLLIISRKHYLSMGEVPSILYKELEEIQSRVKNVLKKTYSQSIFFEHGIASQTKRGGCCVEHAHLHCVPVTIDLLGDLAKHFRYNKINFLSDLKEKFKKEEPYFFLEDNAGERYVFHLPDIVPSQYIRKMIAQKIGRPERWDWRTFIGVEEIKMTIKKLKNKF